MPELFPSTAAFALCAAIMVGAQFIYATVGFGAGMFAVALLAFVLPDLAGTVAVLMLLTFVTEITVLWRAWRHADLGLLIVLLLPITLGLVAGTYVLLLGEVHLLKRGLGLVVAGAGGWFLRARAQSNEKGHSEGAGDGLNRPRWWQAGPVGLLAGLLGGMFGTAGPPLIIYLHGRGLGKTVFRATLVWLFFGMSLIRVPLYVHQGILNGDVVVAALWLLPAAALGAGGGMLAHHRISERHFARLVALLLAIMGLLLALRGGS
jgi:uncharacterized membrane protein YfcA